MPIDYTHQHVSSDIMQVDSVHTPINPTGSGDPATLPRASYSGNAVTIADGAFAELTWNSLGSGDALFDLTDPTRPAVIAAGIYSVTVVVDVFAVSGAAGHGTAVLHLDLLNDDAICQQSFDAGNGDWFVGTSLNSTYYLPLGGVVMVQAYNFDGALSRDFRLREALIQKIA